VLAATDLSYLPRNDPTTPVKRAVVRLWPTFSGKKSGIGLLGTGFVVRREGDRAWIATALHVVRDPDDYGVATKVEAELFTGPMPEGLLPPRLEVILPPYPTLREDGDDLIILEIRGLPMDVQTLRLTKAQPEGSVRVVGHPAEKPPWTEELFRILKLAPSLLYLDGELNPGASGSPVLNGSGQVVGIVYRATSSSGGEELKYVMAYRTSAIEAKLR
jgi:superkiller protein 3